MTDQFEPAYRTLVVACKSDKRWFDLDAVRGPYSENTNARTAKGVTSRQNTDKSAHDEGRGGNFSTLNVVNNDGAGAPPLDYWLLDTQAGVDRVLKSMCPERVCRICGEPSRRITENTDDYQAAVDQMMAKVKPETSGSNASNPGKLQRGQAGLKAGVEQVAYGKETVGWTDCLCLDTCRAHDPDGLDCPDDCPHRESHWRAGVVLDPFDLTTEGTQVGQARYIIGDVFDTLATLPDNSVDLVFSSPPFLALRSYLPADHPDKGKEIGSEATPADFLDTLLDVVEACDRVLAPHGSLCFELGDTFAGSGGAGGDYNEGGLRDGQPKANGSQSRAHPRYRADYLRNDGRVVAQESDYEDTWEPRPSGGMGWPLPKSLCGIPTLFAWSLAYGRNLLRPERTTPRWRIRNVVVWARPNPPVGALGDKFRPATSYLTVACKSDKRWFDLDAVRSPGNSFNRPEGGPNGDVKANARQKEGFEDVRGLRRNGERVPLEHNPAGAPPLDYWEIPTQPYAGSHYACVDEQTEALTPHGWRGYGQVRPGDLIAAYEPDAGTWRWQPVREMRSYLYDGPMVSFEKRTLSQRLTPNHRVLYRTRKQPEPQIRRADEITERAYLPMSAPMALDIPTDGPGEKLAALAGWMVTEGGWASNRAMIYQSETANPEKCDTIRGLLDGVGAEYDERKGHNGGLTFTIRGDLAFWLMGYHKNLPMEAVFDWPIEDATALFEAMIDGDGHRRPNGRVSFIQKSESVTDAFQALATRLGYRTMQSQLRGDGIRVCYCAKDRWVDLRAGDGGLDSAISTEHYEGVVWCPRVDSGIWFARRNGRPFITGNTFPDKLVVRPVKAMCPSKVCRVCGEPSRRITERTYTPRSPNGNSKLQPRVQANPEGVNPSAQAMQHGEADMHVETIGWTDCGHNDWRNGVLLDPFAGSGTSLSVATGHGRDAIGVDLDSRNAELALERVGPLFLTVETLEGTEPFPPPAEDVRTDVV